MQQDQFFSDYGDKVLLIQGTVTSVERQDGSVVVGLATGVPMKVNCSLDDSAAPVRVGETVTLQSTNPRHDASRAAGAVVIQNCHLADHGT